MNHRLNLTILALAGTLLGGGCAASAQSAPSDQGPPAPSTVGPHAHHRGMMARALDGINITSGQRTQIQAAKQKFMAARKTDSPETPAQFKSDVEAALTPTQRTQFESNVKSVRQQMRAERQARMQQQNDQPSAPAPQAT